MKKILFISGIILLFNSIFTGEIDEKVLIVYYGRSCFEIRYLGKRIVIDPFDPDFFDYASRKDKYSLPKGRVDYAFASHKAHDHNYFEGINADETYFASGEKNEFGLHKGKKTSTIKGKTTIKFQGNPFTFWTVPSYHDDQKGTVEGVNGIICFDLEGLAVVHLGDVGHVLEQKHLDTIGKVDVLMIPVDECYTIDAGTAVEIVEQLNPRIVIPMHYKTDNLKSELPFSDEKNFVKNYQNVIYQDKCFISINKNDLENDLKIVVLKYFKE